MTIDVVELGGGVDVVLLSRTVQTAPAAGIDVVLAAGGPMGPPGPAGGSTIVKAAAQALGGHRVVKTAPDAKVDYPDHGAPDDGGLILGVTAGAAGPGAAVVVHMSGEIDEGSWSWFLGPVFCGADGALTQTPPAGAAWLRQVGIATAPTRLLVDLQPAYILA